MFEILDSDLLGRNGIILSKKGEIRTPAFVPVVHPEVTKNLVDVSVFQSKFAVDFIITSSYILRRRFSDKKINLHELTNFQGPIMTDSGAFQSLVYGEIDLTPESVIEYQESIGSDFAVPLDLPISKKDSYDVAKAKIHETILRSQNVPSLIKSPKTSWVGPIQGGKYLDLVEKTAIETNKVDSFSMFAIGSVVELMNDYKYDTLIDIILTAKQILNPAKPVHLFGAGHPSMFPLIVAAGCDTFDSAAYALYAQDDRYMTNNYTYQLADLNEFPCNCPICSNNNPKDVLKQKKLERKKLLAAHNLYVCQTEIKNIRSAISSGTFWNLLESRSRVHPSLRRGFNRLQEYSRYLAKNSTSTKKKGILFTSESDLNRPEIILHKNRLKNLTASKRKKLLLISLLNDEIKETYEIYKVIKNFISEQPDILKNFEIWFVAPYFGLVPIEVSDIYPLTQSVLVKSISKEKLQEIIFDSIDLVKTRSFQEIILLGEIKEFIRLEKESNLLSKLKTKIKTFGFTISEDNISDLTDIFATILA
ncbi:MAG: tRNA guanosine(15) transglycosylase TgtA [Candidatus Heimdallarchaeota archaeon]|nr:tRNA guanosine(15) transglycosylase TgtA [Candidatus Heimdallarchaeota archaeon]MBY8994693.1 tRNA guanosine(15) transglycosylase TgtA [Candidatus Heimdallarchaeota archaeon]